MQYDYDRLRNDLIEHFGTAVNAASLVATMDLIEVQKASDQELLLIAHDNGFILREYLTGDDS